MASETQTSSLVITPEELLKHWQEHRRLTRKLLAAFPEDQLFQFSIGGMRPFSELIKIHHRGQGYIYLRALGVEPPAFYDRS